jgi:hypothetical protein
LVIFSHNFLTFLAHHSYSGLRAARNDFLLGVSVVIVEIFRLTK